MSQGTLTAKIRTALRALVIKLRGRHACDWIGCETYPVEVDAIYTGASGPLTMHVCKRCGYMRTDPHGERE